MSKDARNNRKKTTRKAIDCRECKDQSECCRTGAWVDLEQAKEIVSLGLKGEFFQLEKDRDFPSGFRIGTSYHDNCCTFLTSDGLCSIHKISYELKPQPCKEFPYEKDKLSPFVKYLCRHAKSKRKNK